MSDGLAARLEGLHAVLTAEGNVEESIGAMDDQAASSTWWSNSSSSSTTPEYESGQRMTTVGLQIRRMG